MNTLDKEKRPIRVAIVSSSLSRNAGGILPIMQNHALELAQRGLEVSVHGLEDSFIDADAEGWGGLPIHLAPCHGPAKLAFGPKLAESLAAVAPDIVHQHGIWQMTSATVSRWGRKTGRPIVVSAQGMLEPWALSHSRAKKRIMGALLERRNLSGASAIHVSRSEIAGVRAYVPGTPIAVLPNGAQPFDGPDPERPAFLPEDGRRTLLFLGRLHPKKGISETLKAWRKLKETDPALATQWRLAIVGWDDGGHAAAFEVEA
ncbi:MAG: glycosyltransferase, partial [Pseudomonadota bacterium]